MTTEDPRSVRSRAALRDALLSQTASGAAVSVTAICEAAGLNRGTFYLHFDDVDALASDVVRAATADVFSQWKELRPAHDVDLENQSRLLITGYLCHIDDHRAFYRWLLGSRASWSVVQDVVGDYVTAVTEGLELSHSTRDKQGARVEKAMLGPFLGGALFGVVAHWVSDPAQLTAAELGDWLWKHLLLASGR